jgi:hypothetical protein
VAMRETEGPDEMLRGAMEILRPSVIAEAPS